MNVCTNHPEKQTDNTCAGCKRPFCAGCLLPFERLFLCESCKETFLVGESKIVEDQNKKKATKKRRQAASRGTWTQWAGGIAALLFVALFGFIVVNRLTAPLVAERRAEKLDGALTELAKVGAAVEHYRVKNGAFPDSLEGLVPDFLPEVPKDPYGKGPPLYRNTKKNVVLYSRGPDKKDDEGEPYDPDSKKGDLLYPLFKR